MCLKKAQVQTHMYFFCVLFVSVLFFSVCFQTKHICILGLAPVQNTYVSDCLV